MKVIPEMRGADNIKYTMYTFLLQNSKYTLNANGTPNFKYKITNNKKRMILIDLIYILWIYAN